MKLKTVDELRPTRIYAGAVVGDTWVSTLVAHVDRYGYVFPIRSQHAFFSTGRREAPSCPDLEAALTKCWNGMGDSARLEYSKFFLCLPPWACRSREALSRMTVIDEMSPDLTCPKVDERDVHKLQDLVCMQHTSPSHVVCDLLRHAFTLDSGTAVLNPLGATTRTLSLGAHLVMAEISPTRSLLDCLRELGVRVDVMTSSYSAAASNLTAAEGESGAIVADVDSHRTYCGFYVNHTLVHTAAIPLGSAAVLGAAARRLRMRSSRELAQWVHDREELFRTGRVDADAAQPTGGADNPLRQALRKLEQAVSTPVGEILGSIPTSVMLQDNHQKLTFRKLVFTGDDPLTLWALEAASQSSRRFDGVWRLPEKVHDEPSLAFPGRSRMLGLLRLGAMGRPRCQPFLETYNQTLTDVLNGWVRGQACRWLQWLRSRRMVECRGRNREKPWKGVEAVLS